MSKPLEVDTLVTFGDFSIRPTLDNNGNHVLKVYTDKGRISIEPDPNNTITVVSNNGKKSTNT